MIRLLARTPDGALELEYPLSQLPAAVRDAALIWLDFEGADADEARRILLDVFDFHQLAVDDALLESHLPRLDDWGTIPISTCTRSNWDKAGRWR